jgi:deoxycytidylate deaminase
VAIGRNSLKKQYCTPSLHAEIDAYLKLDGYYKSIDLDMVVVRFTKDGRLIQSRPCYHCLKTLRGSGLSIKNVYYSKDGEMHKEKFCDMLDSPLTKISSGMRQKALRNKQ